MNLIDTHAHIYAEEFAPDRDAMLEHAFQNGISKIYMPNLDHSSIDGMMELEMKYKGNCEAMMGLHPCYVQKGFEKELYLVEDWMKKRSFAAVGEIGIDLYWDTSTKDIQEEALKVLLELAKQHNIPVVIHSRNAFKEALTLIQKAKDDRLRGVFHCFSGTKEDAEEAIKTGFYLGIGGTVTFKNSGVDKIVEAIGLEHIVLETDAPYLAPVPHRGKRNEPGYIKLVAERISDIKKISTEEVASITTMNALKLFTHGA